jgi:hypothetical protein
MSQRGFRNYGYFFIMVSFYFFGLAAFNLFNFLTGGGDLNRLIGGIAMIAVAIMSFRLALLMFRRARNG